MCIRDSLDAEARYAEIEYGWIEAGSAISDASSAIPRKPVLGKAIHAPGPRASATRLPLEYVCDSSPILLKESVGASGLNHRADTPGTADNAFRVDFLYCLFFNRTAFESWRMIFRINLAMLSGRIWDSTHALCLLSITSFAVFPAVR